MDEPVPGNPRPLVPPGRVREGYILAVLVLVASLLVVYAYWRSAQERQLAALREDFSSRAEEMGALVAQRLGSLELVTRGGVSLAASVARPSRRQWRNYVEGLDIGERFPSVEGLGFAAYTTRVQLMQLQKMLHDSGEGRYSLWPRGLREHYGAALYLEPATSGNRALLGYDMYSEPVRRQAMQLARDSGRAQLSAMVHAPAGEGAGDPVLLLYQPVYRAGDRPADVAARRISMQGWVYVAFRMRPFVEAVLDKAPGKAWLRIDDVSDDGSRMLYADRPPDGAGQPAFVHDMVIDAYGRRWRLRFSSQPEAVIERGMTGLRSTLAVGVLASLLLFLIAQVLARTRARAEQLAERMNESYRRSELRFRSAMQHSGMGMALLDHEGRIVETNPALQSMLGQSGDALVGSSLYVHFAERGDPANEPGLKRGADGVLHATRSLVDADGELRQLELACAAVQGDVGQDVAQLVEIEDVTERLHAQAQILALNRSLEARVVARTRDLSRANDELESFAYSISHDLRAPLRAIEGFSRLLAERHGDEIDEAGRAHLERVRNAATRMGELIESLLKMARLGRGGLKPETLDLARMAEEVATELRAADPTHSAVIEIARPLHANGDPGLVFNLLENLLGNAWKFTRGRADAHIAIGRTREGEFFVRDNGAGFEPDYANKLFRPFQRLHAQEQFAGHGIGLASVKRIVEMHGGTIRAEGAPGEGAAFYFTLPDSGSGPDSDVHRQVASE